MSTPEPNPSEIDPPNLSSDVDSWFKRYQPNWLWGDGIISPVTNPLDRETSEFFIPQPKIRSQWGYIYQGGYLPHIKSSEATHTHPPHWDDIPETD